MPVLEVARDDQYLVVTAETPLLEVWEAVPEGLVPPFPPVELPGGLGGLLLRGGFGQTFFFPSEVLGLEFRTPAGAVVRAGGRVIKNVQGYDLVRPFVGSFGLLGEPLSATLRLRPARAQGLFRREGTLEGLPAAARFAWAVGDEVYVYAAGHPRALAELSPWDPVEAPLDLRPHFPNGMGVGRGPVRDLRFSWADGGRAPEPHPLFKRLAEALSAEGPGGR